jgi:hypothetical protein
VKVCHICKNKEERSYFDDMMMERELSEQEKDREEGKLIFGSAHLMYFSHVKRTTECSQLLCIARMDFGNQRKRTEEIGRVVSPDIASCLSSHFPLLVKKYSIAHMT